MRRKKMWKKRFAAILLWTLCLTSMLVLAVSTNAQATTAEASGKSAVSLTRGEWIHRLVTKFDLSVSKVIIRIIIIQICRKIIHIIRIL